MKMPVRTNHHTLVEALRRRVLEGPSETLQPRAKRLRKRRPAFRLYKTGIVT